MSGTSRDAGKYPHVVIGEVTNVADPWQAGAVKVQWRVGSAVQDELSDEERPWTRCLYPSTNPSLKQVGGPHTGLKVGSKVYGMPVDGSGQDFLIIGSIVPGSNGQPDQTNDPDSEVPTVVKQQEMDGLQQPKYGDHNNVSMDHGELVRQSIVDYARDKGGPKKQAAKYADPTDTVGDLDAIV